MITPLIRQDLQLLPGTPMEDGSPSWLIYDNLRNKYFTLGLNAFRILRHCIAGVDSKQFIEEVCRIAKDKKLKQDISKKVDFVI